MCIRDRVNIDQIKNICVVGAGNMGHQIAIRGALSGYEVVCTDVSEEQLGKAEAFAAQYLPERVKKGRLTEEQAKNAQANISFTNSLEEASKQADFVIEAATEKLELKRDIFAQLDALCRPETILATNSSYSVGSKIADATGGICYLRTDDIGAIGGQNGFRPAQRVQLGKDIPL